MEFVQNPWVWAFLAGASVALMAGLAAAVILQTSLYKSTYRHHMPIWFTANRLIILWVAQLLSTYVSWRFRRALETKLILAGYETEVSAIEFIAAQWVLAFYGVGCSLVIIAPTGMSVFWAVAITILTGGVAFYYPRLWLLEQVRARQRSVFKALPFFLDMVTLCVESGLNLQGALMQTVLRCPPSLLRDEIQVVLTDIRTGVSRSDALRRLASRHDEPSLRRWVVALIQAESVGMSLSVILKIQAQQGRQERFIKAEKKAMEAPVKMLFPLALCIFPCTFLVIGFPVLTKFLGLSW